MSQHAVSYAELPVNDPVSTATGTLELAVLPSPSCPNSLNPQQYALPPSRAHECSPPAEIKKASCDAASAACGAGASAASVAVSEISTAGITTAGTGPAAIVPALAVSSLLA